MRKLHLIVWLLVCVLATNACTSAGRQPSPPVNCPQPPQPPAALMVAPTTGIKVRAELLAPPMPATRR